MHGTYNDKLCQYIGHSVLRAEFNQYVRAYPIRQNGDTIIATIGRRGGVMSSLHVYLTYIGEACLSPPVYRHGAELHFYQTTINLEGLFGHCPDKTQ